MSIKKSDKKRLSGEALAKSRLLDFAFTYTQYNCVRSSFMQKYLYLAVFLQEAPGNPITAQRAFFDFI